MAKEIILHIDDDPDTLSIVKDMLESGGFKIDSAHSGKEGLAMLQKNKYDFILLDVLMPDMSGWDIYQQIRKKGIRTKVAFLSAIECSKERMKKLKQEGVSDYIIKPIDPIELKKRVATIIRK
ncbi:MAG: response regulator [Nanoarchaeota archaeon]